MVIVTMQAQTAMLAGSVCLMLGSQQHTLPILASLCYITTTSVPMLAGHNNLACAGARMYAYAKQEPEVFALTLRVASMKKPEAAFITPKRTRFFGRAAGNQSIHMPSCAASCRGQKLQLALRRSQCRCHWNTNKQPC